MLDLVNSFFVLAALAAALNDIRQLRADREVKGYTLATAALFTAWPLWDLIYYEGLHQWFSLAACALLWCARATWLTLAYVYERAARPD